MSFRKIYDAMTKGPLIEEAFGKVEIMHDLARESFLLSFECLFEEDMATADKCLEHLSSEDIKINKLERQIRKEVFEYMAVSTAPNINASLILVSTVIDYERIGDISQNIAELNHLFPAKLEEDEYKDCILAIKANLLEIFDYTKASVREGDSEKALKAVALHDEVKNLHSQLIEALNKDPDLSAHTGMLYALLSYYLRRINGHLGNISSTALGTFPKMGFLSRTEMIDLDE